MFDYDRIDRLFSTAFSVMCRTDEGMTYLKVRTLIDRDALLRSSALNEYLLAKGIHVQRIVRQEIQQARRKLCTLVRQHSEIDSVIRSTYTELHGTPKFDRLQESLRSVAERGDSYWQGWNTVHRDNIRGYIQSNFVRKPSIETLDDLLGKIDSELSNAVVGYTVISWYNQWSSTIIESLFNMHPKVLPTVRKMDKVDFFFAETPIDLKVTFLPDELLRRARRQNRNSNDSLIVEQLKAKPLALAKWLYENQGEMRFSDSNRLFVILIDEDNLANSWKLKADFPLVKSHVMSYLDTTSRLPEVEWEFRGSRTQGTFKTFSDVIFVTRSSGSS